MNKTIFLILFFSLVSIKVKSQTIITLENAIEMALKNNYGIQISNHNIKLAKNNTTRGNAGLLPSLNASGSGNYNSMDDSRNTKNPNAFSLGTGIQMDYTIFEGGSRKVKFELLKTQLGQAELNQREVIETTILSITDRYLSVAIALENKLSQENSLTISKERLKLIQVKNEFGSSNSLDVLNAKVDFNKDSIRLMNLNHQYLAEKLYLVELISREWRQSDFDIELKIESYTAFNIESLIRESLTANVGILNKQNQMTQSQQNIRLVKSGTYPKLTFQSSYNYNSNFSPDYKTRELRSGLNLSIPIFNGGQQKIKLKNARLQMLNQQFGLKKKELHIEKQVRLLWQNFQNKLQNIRVEQSNLKASELNLSVSKEMLKNGQITNTQFREAQQNLLQAKTNIANARFTAKKLEYQLLQISGRLLKIVD